MSDVVGIGTDLEEAERFRSPSYEDRPSFFKRIFSAEEIQYCATFSDPAPHFAARFCAKEALVKAAGPKVGMLVTECEIRNDDHGVPTLIARSKREKIIRFFQKHHVRVSLSHTSSHALAFVVVIRKAK